MISTPARYTWSLLPMLDEAMSLVPMPGEPMAGFGAHSTDSDGQRHPDQAKMGASSERFPAAGEIAAVPAVIGAGPAPSFRPRDPTARQSTIWRVRRYRELRSRAV